MFFANGADLPKPLRKGLEDFSGLREIDGEPLPIRVLAGRFRTSTAAAWTKDQAEKCGVTTKVAEENGLTIIDWGAISPTYPREWENLPGIFYGDSNPHKLLVRDVLVPQDGTNRSAIPYEVDDNGEPFTLGEIGERTVWYFVNLQHLPSPDDIELDTFLFEPARRALDPDLMSKFKEELEERSANEFARLMASEPQRRYDRQQARIVELEGALRASEEQTAQHLSTLRISQKELDAILSASKMKPEHWKDQYRRIASHPLIAPNTFHLAENRVEYDTKELMLVNPDDGNEVVLGTIRVKISLASGYSVTIENLTNKRRNRDHPHVENTRPCWGGYESEVYALLEKHEVAGLVEFIFGYLQTYNPDDDWGRFARYWFEKPKKKGEEVVGGVEAEVA